MEHIEYVYTVGMNEEDVERHLSDAETGVLSLADGSRAYGVPVHCKYEDGVLLFRLTDDDDSEKLAFLDATTEACFVLYEATNGDSWSVMARGPVAPVDDPAQYDEAAINERFGPARVFDEDIGDTDVRLFELDVESVTGRRTPRFD
ncbi:flavin-nucleotide-binding protein [Salinigranum rubrum]|uniref:Flavin-nucleotide-binding protein n=1 Tax=Salinigranum rubrum TaxID=755307 RepID=A0A2I8VH84_9EURY|nr:pyridoxamine 5'-phosphate oxidase family protein [Salinigranum rubrum]AUV81287.1 flavin-nucleotide-binding protein [Salinigranum rubrum]